MKDIIFKIKDDNFIISVPNYLSNNEFIQSFKTRMENLMIVKDSLKNNIILDIGDRALTNREILQLFDVLNEIEMFYIHKIICKNKAKNSISIYKGHLRGGQIRFFDKSLLFIGNINKGSKIIVMGDLYVLGTINGDVVLKDKTAKIYCECINNSLVKIGDSYKLYSGIVYDLEIECCDGKIKENNYIKGVKEDVKSNCCYIR